MSEPKLFQPSYIRFAPKGHNTDCAACRWGVVHSFEEMKQYHPEESQTIKNR